MPNPPSFDSWTMIFLFASIQGMLFSTVFYFKGDPKGKVQKIYLLVLMLFFCTTLLEYVLWWTGYLRRMPHLMNVTAVFNYLFGPILFFYFKQVFRSKSFTVKSDWLHLILAALWLLFHIPFFFYSSETKIAIMTNTRPQPPIIPWPWINVLQLTFYAIIIYYEFKEDALHTKEVKKWYSLILILFSLYIISVIIYLIFVRQPWFSPMWDYMISFSMVAFIFGIALYGYFNDKVFNGFDLFESTEKKKYQNSSLRSDFGDQIMARLDHLMVEEKLYVDDEINLEKLALKLGVTRHQLSQVLNEHAGLNFFEYINQRRIEEAKTLLLTTSKKELNIIEIAYKVGYSNKVTFNNTFKKHTGMTPSEFRMSPPVEEKGNILPIRKGQI